MISVVLGLQFVPQVFNIFEKRILSAHERLGDQQKIIFWVDYNDSCENVSEVSKTLENHTNFSNSFWSEAAMSGANS